MWQLPPLEWQSSAWKLPLCADSAAKLVVSLLEEPQAAVSSLASLLQTDRALTLWGLCRAPHWKSSPPANPNELAEWFLQAAIPDGVFDVAAEQVTEFSNSNDLGSVTATAGSAHPSENHAENWASILLRGSADWLSHYGPPVSHETFRGCPWFPSWLELVGERNGRIQRAPDLPESELGRLLSRTLGTFRRWRALEADFAATLEREKIAALRELAYGASHEINNPLANIATRAQTLLQEESNPDRKRKLATIAAQAFRAHEMIADMMLFAKPPAPSLRTFDVREIVNSVVREVMPDAALQQTQVHFEPPSEAVTISADGTQIGVAIKALLRNALEALVTGGSITVILRTARDPGTAKDWVEVLVRDTGPGIPANVRTHLFDPFYSGREAGRGLGFGLAKTWRIAELHAGSIEVESELGRGATFTLRIPNISH